MNLAYKYYYTETIGKNGKKLKEYAFINYEHWEKVSKAKGYNKNEVAHIINFVKDNYNNSKKALAVKSKYLNFHNNFKKLYKIKEDK